MCFHLYLVIAVALNSVEDPAGTLSKVLIKSGGRQRKHLPSCGAPQGLQLSPQLAAKVADLFQGHILHQIRHSPAWLQQFWERTRPSREQCESLPLMVNHATENDRVAEIIVNLSFLVSALCLPAL